MKILLQTNSDHLTMKTISELSETENISGESIFYFDYDNEDGFIDSVKEYLSSSFLEDKKLIVLRNSEVWKSQKNDDLENKYIERLFNAKTENIYIFISSKVCDKNKSLIEHKDEINLITLPAPKNNELIEFIEYYLNKNNIKIEKKSIKKLIDITEGDFDNIINELKKFELIDENIDNKLIEKVVFDRKGESVFKLINAIHNKNTREIMLLVDKMQSQDISVFMIINILISDITWMILIKKMLLEYVENDVKEIVKLNPYRFSKIKNCSHKYNKKQLEKLLLNFINMEIDFKSNATPEIYRIFKSKLISIIDI